MIVEHAQEMSLSLNLFCDEMRKAPNRIKTNDVVGGELRGVQKPPRNPSWGRGRVLFLVLIGKRAWQAIRRDKTVGTSHHRQFHSSSFRQARTLHQNGEEDMVKLPLSDG